MKCHLICWPLTLVSEHSLSFVIKWGSKLMKQLFCGAQDTELAHRCRKDDELLVFAQEYNKFSFCSISCGSCNVFLGQGILVWEWQCFKCTFKNRYQFHIQKQKYGHGLKICLLCFYLFIFYWCGGWYLLPEKEKGFISLRHAPGWHVRSNVKQKLIRGVKNMHSNMHLPYFLNTLLLRNWDLIITICFGTSSARELIIVQIVENGLLILLA